MKLIELNNITKIYGSKDAKVVALDNINLTIEQGEMVSIMGPSGSGKTTLLSIIGCMDTATTGEYYIKGTLVSTKSNLELSKIRNSTISFVFQHFALMKDYSIYENIELPLVYRKMSSKAKKERIMYYCRKLGIQDLVNKKPSQISGGQQQRVAIARALSSEAEIILADEPTGALDQKTGEELLDLLKNINREDKTIIIVTHDSKVSEYCNRKLFIRDGKIITDSYIKTPEKQNLFSEMHSAVQDSLFSKDIAVL